MTHEQGRLPKNLIYIRHGQSERNLANRQAIETGDQSAFGDLLTRPTSFALLTEEGKRQAAITGAWINGLGIDFDRLYTSSYNRAKQTAGLLGLRGAQWIVSNRIRERNSGVMEDMTVDERQAYLDKIKGRGHKLDPFNFRPDRGDSFADIEERWRGFLGTLARECSEMNVGVVNHGGNMWVARYIHERWTNAEFVSVRGDVTQEKMPNCMVIHYTRVNPETGDEEDKLNWMRTCCPWEDPTPGPWRRIVRRLYSNEELLSQVGESSRFLESVA